MPTPRMQPPSVTLSSLATSYKWDIKDDNAPNRTEEAKPFKAPKPEKPRERKKLLAAGRLANGSGQSKAAELCGDFLPTVSVGSVGHPHSCAEGCKYVSKKNRGCKDGAACTRCHLCKWVKRKVKAAPSILAQGQGYQCEQDGQK